jgi:hypothetical protein
MFSTKLEIKPINQRCFETEKSRNELEIIGMCRNTMICCFGEACFVEEYEEVKRS